MGQGDHQGRSGELGLVERPLGCGDLFDRFGHPATVPGGLQSAPVRARTLVVVSSSRVATATASGGSDEFSGPPGAGAAPAVTAPPGGVDLTEKEFEDFTGQAEVVVQARDNTFIPA